MLIVINIAVSILDIRWDLTSDNRYTLSQEARDLLRRTERPLTITVLLHGDLPATFVGFRDYIDYYLSELRRRNPMLQVRYQNPNEGAVEEVRQFKAFLRSQGVNSFAREVSNTGEISKSELFPYVSIDDGRRILFVDLLEVKRPSDSEESAIHRSQLTFESKFLRSLRVLLTDRRPEVHIIGTHARLMAEGFNRDSRMEAFQFVASDGDLLLRRRDSLSAVMVVPETDIEHRTLVALDQLGLMEIPLVWLVDKFDVSLDSIGIDGAYLATHKEYNYEDYLFKMGVKLAPSLIMDLQSTRIPQVVGAQGGQTKTSLLAYPFHLLVAPYPLPEGYPLSTGGISMKFVAPIDTLRSSGQLNKTPLLTTSPYSRVMRSPVTMSFDFLRVQPDPQMYDEGRQLLAVECRGEMPAYFNRRWSIEDVEWMKQYGISTPAIIGDIRQVFLSDADFAIPPQGRDGRYYDVGYNIWERRMYEGNMQLMHNLLERLTFGDALLSLSTRRIEIPILDRVGWADNRTHYIVWLLALPLLVLCVTYGMFHYFRKRRYEKYHF